MRCMSSRCDGIYMFRMIIGVSGLLLIIMAWRYDDIELGVGTLMMFSFVYIDIGIMARMPPLACVGPVYLLCFCVVLLELLYMILYSCSWRSMYDVDFVFGILVSWMSIMCGFVCSFRVSSWIPGRLELMHPVFQVIIFRV